MAVIFQDLSDKNGLKQLDEYLLTRSYISAYQASKDDLAVYVAIKNAPPAELVNAARWYKHISALLGSNFQGSGVGVVISSSAAAHAETREFVPPVAASAQTVTEAAPAPSTPAPAAAKPAAEEDDDDLDLFGEETEEEKAAAAEREESKKAASKKKAIGKSSVLLDVKPWDDETDMVKLEEIVRGVQMPGLHWGASKLQTVVQGIKKLTIMMTIEDDLVSVDNLIEDLVSNEPSSEYVQSCDIVAFNKICEFPLCSPGTHFGFCFLPAYRMRMLQPMSVLKNVLVCAEINLNSNFGRLFSRTSYVSSTFAIMEMHCCGL